MSNYETGCRYKRSYTKGGAKQALKHLKASRGEHDLSTYNCEFCPWWHVGHDVNKRYKRLSKAFARG